MAPLTPARLRATVAEIIGVPPEAIPEDANLVQLGLDSMGTVRLVTRLRRDGMRVSSRELIAEPTLAALRRRMDGSRIEAAGSTER